jgi:hypothetical protein
MNTLQQTRGHGRGQRTNNHLEQLMNSYRIARMIAVTVASAAALAVSVASYADDESQEPASKAIAQLYEMQAAFHGAAAGAGIDAPTKAAHLSDMLELWTEDGTLVVGTTIYNGRGRPNSPSCAPGSLTLCDFFANHAGTFVLGHNWASLSPTFLTRFEVHGNTADVYFECHYFDVATGAKMSDASIGLLDEPGTAQARKVHGKWLLDFATAGSPALSSH